MLKKKPYNAIIVGAGGRDFHNFLRYFKDNPSFNVVCFTADQIPGIEKRKFPKKLSGRLYKKDIPIYLEKDLPRLIKKLKVDYCFLSYSDLSHQQVMEKASLVLANGANFSFLGTKDTQIKSKKSLISVCAIRTGAGKSQTSKAIGQLLKKAGKKVVAIRHPMPYGNLIKQEVQIFATYADLGKHKCTIEEREEYEPWLKLGFIVYAGVDYEKIVRMAEKEADVIIWDGGNNDFSFFESDLKIVVADPFRPGHSTTYYPGFVNLLLADVVLINKVNTALNEDVRIVEETVKRYNPKAIIIKAASELTVKHGKLLRNKRVLVVEDGPTLTHGMLSHGAGSVALKRYKGRMIDAQKHAVGSIKKIYEKYPHLKEELPAMGYSKKQIWELQETINRAKCDVVLDSSPVDLSKLIKTKKPIVEVDYELGKKSVRELERILRKKGFLK